MKAIDTALKTIADETGAAVPNTRKIAGLAMSADITLAQLIAAGLCPAPESGDWVPTLYGQTATGAPTYLMQEAKYIKIGNFVAIFIQNLSISSIGGMAGNVAIGSLPFPVVDSLDSAMLISSRWGSSEALSGWIRGSTSRADLLKRQSAPLLNTDISDDFGIAGVCGCYLTN